MLTIKPNVVQIKSSFITIESILNTIELVSQIELVFHNQVNFHHNRVDFEQNQVDFYHNRVDSGDAHNTFFGSTNLKQTACHRWIPFFCFSYYSPSPITQFSVPPSTMSCLTLYDPILCNTTHIRTQARYAIEQ